MTGFCNFQSASAGNYEDLMAIRMVQDTAIARISIFALLPFMSWGIFYKALESFVQQSSFILNQNGCEPIPFVHSCSP